MSAASVTDPAIVDKVVPRQRRKSRARKVFGRVSTIGSLAVILAWVLVAFTASLIAPYDSIQQSADIYAGPSSTHFFGTDALGRDVFSRVLHGARITLPASLIAVVAAFFIGGVIGLVSGYIGGVVDNIIMRFTDLFFAFPKIILAMAIIATFGPNTRNAVIAIVVVSWPLFARVVRGSVLAVREEDYLAASALLGSSTLSRVLKEVIPNSIGPTVVLATLELGNVVLLLSGLSFLGLGPRPPAAEWGSMISLATSDISKWWIGLFPGLAIVSIVVAFNLMGDALRDWLDPKGVGARG